MKKLFIISIYLAIAGAVCGILLFFIMLPGILLGIGFILTAPDGTHQSDAILIQKFHENRKEFDTLVSMIQEDVNLHIVDNDWTDPHDPSTIGVTPARIAEYRKLFSQCGIPRGFSRYQNPKKIEFIATSFGLVTGGSSKGYVYQIVPPHSSYIVHSIDNYKPKDKRSFVIFRQITTNWYLYYLYDD